MPLVWTQGRTSATNTINVSLSSISLFTIDIFVGITLSGRLIVYFWLYSAIPDIHASALDRMDSHIHFSWLTRLNCRSYLRWNGFSPIILAQKVEQRFHEVNPATYLRTSCISVNLIHILLLTQNHVYLFVRVDCPVRFCIL